MNNLLAGLTEVETVEIRQRPITRSFTNFTDEQLAIRKEIARKTWEKMLMLDATNMTEKHREIYATYPPWKFYMHDALPKRVYGIVSIDDPVRLHTCSALLFVANDTIDGTSAKSLREVDRYNDTQLFTIARMSAPGMFCDPLGFILCFN